MQETLQSILADACSTTFMLLISFQKCCCLKESQSFLILFISYSLCLLHVHEISYPLPFLSCLGNMRAALMHNGNIENNLTSIKVFFFFHALVDFTVSCYICRKALRQKHFRLAPIHPSKKLQTSTIHASRALWRILLEHKNVAE